MRGAGVMDSDLAVMELLDRAAVSYGLVLTKADELKPPEREAALAKPRAEAASHTAALAGVQFTSALTGQGMPELRTSLATLIYSSDQVLAGSARPAL